MLCCKDSFTTSNVVYVGHSKRGIVAPSLITTKVGHFEMQPFEIVPRVTGEKLSHVNAKIFVSGKMDACTRYT